MIGAKYERLGRHLAGLAFDEWRASFKEIEAILHFHLPPSARKYPAWWANDRRQSQPYAWLDAGWKTEQLDLASERVTFRRVRASTSVSRQSRISDPLPSADGGIVRPASDASHLRDESQSFECRFGIEWKPIGSVTLDACGNLNFPTVPPLPSIYRFRIRTAGIEARYIGETENLLRRFGHYRKPGPTQQTNIRLNAHFLAVLERGADIGVSIVDAAWIDRGDGRRPADLSSVAIRRMIENAAIWDRAGADVQVLNRGAQSEGSAESQPREAAIEEPVPLASAAGPPRENQDAPEPQNRRSWWRPRR